MSRKILLIVSVLFLLASVNINAQKAQVTANAKRVLTALKNKDMKTVASFVHPTKGVRFAPYGYLEKSNLTFKKAQVPNLFRLRRSYNWGEFDGSGDPIKLGFPAYYRYFVYNRNFARAPGVAYNERIGFGNGVFNLKEIYPKAKFVGYNFPQGTDGNVMGWDTLYLVFEKSGAKWYLIAVVHDQWVT